jgi:hypothetical protein
MRLLLGYALYKGFAAIFGADITLDTGTHVSQARLWLVVCILTG